MTVSSVDIERGVHATSDWFGEASVSGVLGSPSLASSTIIWGVWCVRY